MKKILSIFLAFTIMFLLSACADNSSQEDTRKYEISFGNRNSKKMEYI